MTEVNGSMRTNNRGNPSRAPEHFVSREFQQYSEINVIEENFEGQEKFLSKEKVAVEELNAQSGGASALQGSVRTLTKEKRTRLRRVGGLLPAVVGTAGVVVVTVAAVALALIQIVILSVAVSSQAITVRLRLSNVGDTALTAVLSDGIQTLSVPVDTAQEECKVLFDRLTPDTQYVFSVENAKTGERYLSENIRTAPFENQLLIAEEGVSSDAIFLQFYESVPAAEVEIFLNGQKVEETEVSAYPNLMFGELEADTPYTIEVFRTATGEKLFSRTMYTAIQCATGEPFCDRNEITVTAQLENPNGRAVYGELFCNDVLVARVDTAEDGEVAFSYENLTADTVYWLYLIEEIDGREYELYRQELRTDSYLIFSTFLEASDGQPILVAERRDEPERFTFSLPDGTTAEEITFLCVSEHGLTLPVEIDAETRTGSLHTQYIADDEYYYLYMYAGGDAETGTLLETRRIHTDFGATDFVRPQFDVRMGEEDWTDDSGNQWHDSVLTVQYLQGHLFPGLDGVAAYEIELYNAETGEVDWTVFTESFDEVSAQKLNLMYIVPNGRYSVRLVASDLLYGQRYVIFSQDIVVE